MYTQLWPAADAWRQRGGGRRCVRHPPPSPRNLAPAVAQGHCISVAGHAVNIWHFHVSPVWVLLLRGFALLTLAQGVTLRLVSSQISTTSSLCHTICYIKSSQEAVIKQYTNFKSYSINNTSGRRAAGIKVIQQLFLQGCPGGCPAAGIADTQCRTRPQPCLVHPCVCIQLITEVKLMTKWQARLPLLMLNSHRPQPRNRRSCAAVNNCK